MKAGIGTGWGGAGGTSTNSYMGRLCPKAQPLTLLYYTKVPTVVYLLLTKWYPFHLPDLELCIPLNCCKCTALKVAEHSFAGGQR